MYSRARWHAQGLLWIATLFRGAADYLESAGSAAASWEPPPPRLARCGEDYLDDVRSRIHSRYF
jgi:hypothetical protein